MLEKATFGILTSSRALRAGAATALMAAAIAVGAGPVAASTAHSAKLSAHAVNAGNVGAALLIQRKQASAAAAMRLAGVGASLGGNSAR